MNQVFLTNDVETTSIVNGGLRDETGIKVWTEGLPVLHVLQAKYKVKAPFFFIADFTLKTYEQLLLAFQQAKYTFLRYEDYCRIKQSGEALPERFVILRHDVDLHPERSLAMAKVEQQFGVQSVYYFRAVPESWNVEVIQSIAALEHEVGYHYESLTTCKGDVANAYEDFKRNLEALRELVSVTTICMHGSPRSRFDSRDIWAHYNYRDLNIIGEPYFDTDFNNVLYITDTGRCWDGERYNVRDKVRTSFTQHFHTTFEIIQALQVGTMPPCVMVTTHPQRWTNKNSEWLKELGLQTIKNQVKRLFVS